MAPEERVEAIWKLLIQHQPKLSIASIKGEMLRHFQEAAAVERECCRRVILKEADFWHQEWKLRDNREAQLFSAAAVVLASLIAKSPEGTHDA